MYVWSLRLDTRKGLNENPLTVKRTVIYYDILPAILTALDDKSEEGTIVSAQADHSGSRHGTNYENLIGRHFVDSDDEDSDYTVASITGNDVTSTGGEHESWDLDYVLGKLSTHKRRRVR